MITTVCMPKLGQTMEEGTIEKWIKQEGEDVTKGDILLEITTDKATLEVEAYVSGTLRKILASDGSVVPVNDPIALVGDPNEEIPEDMLSASEPVAAAASAETAPAASEAAAAPAPTPQQQPGGRIFASPRAKKLAASKNVPLEAVSGSGPNGRIVEKDVLDHVGRLGKVKASPAAKALAKQQGVDLSTIQGTGPGGRITKEDVLSAQTAPAAAAAPPIGEHQPLSAMRRVVAQRMLESKSSIPHYYLTMEFDMTDAVQYRAQINQSGSVRVSFNDMIMKACALAFTKNPKMNCRWEDDGILYRGEINIGTAVAIEDGLVVPVVHNADQLSLTELAKISAGLIEKARNKRLTPDEYTGGCLTLSNLGMLDVDNFVPIINPGESSILGIGRIAEKPVVKDGGIHIRSMMSVTLSCDHRVTDGAISASFLRDIKTALEDASNQIS